MKKLLSTNYSDTGFNIAIFFLRIVLSLLMLADHGVPKLVHFGEWQHSFYNFMHIGSRWSLVLSILAEVFASMLLVLGFFSRIAALLLIIDMSVVIFLFHSGQVVKNYEDAAIFLAGFFCILLVGPGKWSVDGLAGK